MGLSWMEGLIWFYTVQGHLGQQMGPPTCSSLASQASAVEIGDKAMADLKKKQKNKTLFICLAFLLSVSLREASRYSRVPRSESIITASLCMHARVCVHRPVCTHVGACVFFERLFDICSFYFKLGLDFNAINLKMSFKSQVKVVHNSLVHSLSPNFIEVSFTVLFWVCRALWVLTNVSPHVTSTTITI